MSMIFSVLCRYAKRHYAVHILADRPGAGVMSSRENGCG